MLVNGLQEDSEGNLIDMDKIGQYQITTEHIDCVQSICWVVGLRLKITELRTIKGIDKS